MRLSTSVVLGCVLLLVGCDVGLGRSVIVVNQTSDPLTIDGNVLEPHGGDWNYGFQGCGQAPLEILDADGEEYVQIDAGWCDGEIWTITGPGEVSVEDQE